MKIIKKDSYIKELEKQIKLRDFLIKELLFFNDILKMDKEEDNNKSKINDNNILLTLLKKKKIFNINLYLN